MGSNDFKESLQTDLLQGFPAFEQGAVGSSIELPVARVLVETHVPHLDRLFDYLVPEDLASVAQPGVRVKVPFGSRTVQGFIRERTAESSLPGRLLPLKQVISPVPVVSTEVFEIADEVASRFAGVTQDVLRLAVPARIARAEDKYIKKALTSREEEIAPDNKRFSLKKFFAEAPDIEPCETSGFNLYNNGPEFIEDLPHSATRAVMTVLPASMQQHSWENLLAAALVTAANAGKGSIAVVPEQKSLQRLSDALSLLVREEHFVQLTGNDKPSQRYENFMKVRTGEVRIVIGTRSAAYAPVHNLGFVACWDDGDSNLIERRAPYSHARDVLLLRAQHSDCAALFMGYSMSSESARLVKTRWATYLGADRSVVRDHSPRVLSTGDEYQLARDPMAAFARIPQVAYQLAQQALKNGPVLVQVARAGYVPSLACQRCRMPARCQNCRGPLKVTGQSSVPECGWCGRGAHQWKCSECGYDRWRMSAVGALRTAEELGRAFPDVPVISSSGEHVRADIGAEPALVVATPGAEPVADGGYSATLLLDADRMYARDSLRAPEMALRRWLNAAALTRPFAQGGRVVCTAQESVALQALVRWDPVGFALEELEERAQLMLPPAVRTAAITGEEAAVKDFLGKLNLPEDVRVVGPAILESPEGFYEQETDQVLWRVILFFSYARAHDITPALRAARSASSALKIHSPVQIRCDGLDIL
ncbi:primosomal protein N' [Rothia terrae]|uniref:Probable replication restart protein PriA n=1 Tax=Rothia terrae TaxID=396015 RepID=A0A7H2BB18_9MICC|nr:primosomal protein N' [Rothia terrae]QNV36864.1 primosomal protein N' [Rothia terrae]